jgi:hypothetical protein
VGHKYSLILSREITDEEMAILQESGCYGTTFVTDTLPTDPKVKVTKVDIDDTVSPSLEAAIQSGLDAVIQVPDLSAPAFRVPALPVAKKSDQPAVVAGEVMDDELSVGNEVQAAEANGKQAANGKTSAKRAANGKTAAKRTTSRKAAAPADEVEELSEAGAMAD